MLKIIFRFTKLSMDHKLFEIQEFIHNDNSVQGILISLLDFQDSLIIEQFDNSATQQLIAKIVILCTRTLVQMMRSIAKYPYPIEKASNLKKLAFHKLDQKISILKRLYDHYHQLLDDFFSSPVKNLICKYMEYLYELCSFCFSHKQLRMVLAEHVSAIFKISFSFLKFERFDIEKLKTDPMNLLLDIEYIVEDHVSSSRNR